MPVVALGVVFEFVTLNNKAIISPSQIVGSNVSLILKTIKTELQGCNLK